MEKLRLTYWERVKPSYRHRVAEYLVNGKPIPMEKLFDCENVEKLIAYYMEHGGECVELIEGTLGYGRMILYGDGLKTAIVEEIALNEWSSAHTIRWFNNMPKKYAEELRKAEAAGSAKRYETWKAVW